MKTKIIASYGPALHNMGVLSKVIKHVDMFRINFSHGDPKEWLEDIRNIRLASKATGCEVALIADLPGPKMRLGIMPSAVAVAPGDKIIFKYGKSSNGVIPLDHNIAGYVRRGSILAIGDGTPRFKVASVSGGSIVTAAMDKGKLVSNKGINVMKGDVTAATPTDEDIELAAFARRNGFDFIALSFVRSAADIARMRKKAGGLPIIAKIERADAVKQIDRIAQEADAIMVARGDLAFEINLEMIPIAQARIIESARKHRKPVIVATQMLASMVSNPSPTRAEVNDIANAVVSGADCVMLSEETAVGAYPVEAVRLLANTAKNAEAIRTNGHRFKIAGISDGIAFAATEMADNFKTECIFAPTQTGRTAIMLSCLRPESDIIALSGSEKVRKRLKIWSGVHTERISRYGTTDQMFTLVRNIAKHKRINRYIVVSGSPNKVGSTDTLKYIE